MNSTYKLLGVEWDHGSLPSYLPSFIRPQKIETYTADRNLFDLDEYVRRIDISEIFSSSGDKLMAIVDEVKECDAIYINIDYEPASCSIDVRSFYYLRVLQAIAYFENNLNNKTIIVMASELFEESCREKWMGQQSAAPSILF